MTMNIWQGMSVPEETHPGLFDHRCLPKYRPRGKSSFNSSGIGLRRVGWVQVVLSILDPSLVSLEVNGIKSKPLMLSRSICQACVGALIHKLKANPVLHEITLPGANTPASYSTCTNDVTAYAKSNAEIDEDGKKISRSEVTGANITRDKSVGLRLGAWKGVSLPRRNGLLKIFGVWFGHDANLEKNWLEVR